MDFQHITTNRMINIEQNTDKQLRRLGAQRHLYGIGKDILLAQVILSVPAAILTTILAIVYPKTQSFVTLWGVFVTISDLAWLTPWQNNLRNKASKIQEIFDCEVFQLPWNALKAGDKPDPELIIEQSNKYKKWAHRMPAITNWYPAEVDELPVHVGRIICQRVNCWWDAQQRRRFATWVVMGTIGVFIILFLISYFSGITLEKFILNVVVPFLPAALLGIRQYQEHMETANKLDALKVHSEDIWAKALSNAPEDELKTMSRNLQDEILESRRGKPFVLDSIYKRFQPSFEKQMNYSTAELVQAWINRNQ